MASILVLGATGYVGGRLVPRLLERGHNVRCLVRNRNKISGRGWKNVEIIEGDLLKPETLPDAFKNIDAVYYLVHSMASKNHSFESLDRTAAANVARTAAESGIKRIIYLGGLGKKTPDQSAHLKSRHEVGDTLRTSKLPVTEFRAAVIVGSGSVSFELIHHLTNRLPVMICPRWVYTKTQPIAIADILRYLVESLDKPESAGRILDIGGPEVLTYRDMILTVARVLNLKRFLIQVPVLTPRLSSYWVNLVTPIPAQIARPLIEGLRYETICENDDARHIFDFIPMNLETAVHRALASLQEHRVETIWTGASTASDVPPLDPSHFRTDIRTLETNIPAEKLFSEITSIGGEKGWYYADWLWKFRGFIDKQIGGVGLRRGRRHPTIITPGEALDFWRVEEIIPDQKLLLRAEMIVWGQAWLEFRVEKISDNSSRLVQTARYYPKGLFGLLYWYSVYPIHSMVFRGMIKKISASAQKNQK